MKFNEELVKAGVKRVPSPMPGAEPEIEIRRVFDAEDFGDLMTPELREREAELLRKSEANAKG